MQITDKSITRQDQNKLHLSKPSRASKYRKSKRNKLDFLFLQWPHRNLAQNLGIQNCIVLLHLNRCLFGKGIYLIFMLLIKHRHSVQQYKHWKRRHGRKRLRDMHHQTQKVCLLQLTVKGLVNTKLEQGVNSSNVNQSHYSKPVNKIIG